MCARAALLRITDDCAAGAGLFATLILFERFAVTLVRFELFAFFDRFCFFIVCPLLGTREPYACLERSKGQSKDDKGGPSEVCSLWKKQKTQSEKFRTALRAAETFDLVVALESP